MGRCERAKVRLEGLTQGEYESPTTYGKRAWKLFLQASEVEEHWAVRRFIAGVVDEEFWCILQRERNRNRKMTLDVAIKRLRDLYILANETNYDPDPDSEDESEFSAKESEYDTRFTATIPLSYFIVSTIPQHILSDPVAFNQFLKLRNSIPSFERSGPFSRKSVEALQAAHGQQSSASNEKHNQVAGESPTVIAEKIYIFAADSVSRQPESITEIDIYSQSKAATILGNGLPPPDLWVELPFHNDSTVDASNVAANGSMAVNARTEMGSKTLEAADCELEVLSIVDEGMERYQNSTGEKEVEKWREKDCFLRDGNKEKAVSTIDLGARMKSCARDLVNSGWKPDAVEAAGGADEERFSALATSGERKCCAERIYHGTTEEAENSSQSHSSDGITGNAIRNPSALQIRTPSEWDPGPDNLEEAIPATGEGEGPLSIAFGDLRFVNPEKQGVVPNFQSPTTVMATTSPKLKESQSGYQIQDVADVSSRAIRSPVVQRIRAASKSDLGPCESEYTSLVLKDGNELYKLTFGNPLAVERRRAEPETRDLTGIIAKTTPHGPMHPVAEFLWPPEDGVRQACHIALTRPISTQNARYGLSGITGQAFRGGIDKRRIWDPGGEEAKTYWQLEAVEKGRKYGDMRYTGEG